MKAFFRVAILVSFLFFISVNIPARVSAATPTAEAKALQMTVESQIMDASPTPRVSEYALPYPGILPDHPLYIFKKLRDQILERLISDPVRKMDFYMLQADKGVNTAVFLAAKQQNTLADDSLGQAQGYFKKAVDMAKDVKGQSREVPPYMIERFGNAMGKYEAVMMEMMTTASEDRKVALTNLISSLKAHQADIDGLKQ